MGIKIDNPVSGQPEHSLKDLLSAKGFRSTKGRKIILKELETRREHFNAESLYDGLSRKKQRVSKPTIYRTLKLLEKFRVVEKFDIKKNFFYYEPVFQKGKHGHLICEACGKIIDFPIADVDLIKSTVLKESNFIQETISIRIFGLCESCLKGKKTPCAKT